MDGRLTRMRLRFLIASVLPAAVGVLASLTGCAGTVTLSPAASANDPDCAAITVRLPDDVGDGLTLRRTDAQATGAWGDPSAVILRCGVSVPGPTTQTCVRVDGIDWLVDGTDAPDYVFTTFGRNPATEVIVDSSRASGEKVLGALASAIAAVPAAGGCVSYDDAASIAAEASASASASSR